MKDWIVIPIALIFFMLGFNYGVEGAELVAYPKQVRTEGKYYLEWTSYIRIGTYACIKEKELIEMIEAEK